MTELALAARDVTKRVQDGATRREVLRGVTLEVARGALVVVRGPSGSGKTTLLAVLGGMLLPTSGEVWLDGEPMSRLRDRQRTALRRRKIGYLFQDFALVAGMSALDNVALALVPDAPPRREVVARAASALDRLGLAALAATRVELLSGGERQRVALARALLHDPIVLLLDEPTAHLDTPRVRGVVDDLVALCGEGRAVVVASHDPRLCDDPRVTRVVEIDGGALVSP